MREEIDSVQDKVQVMRHMKEKDFDDVKPVEQVSLESLRVVARYKSPIEASQTMFVSSLVKLLESKNWNDPFLILYIRSVHSRIGRVKGRGEERGERKEKKEKERRRRREERREMRGERRKNRE